MIRQDNVIKILLVEDSADEAEQLVSTLRNGGIAVRPSRAVNETELDFVLDRQTPDLVLSNLKSVELKLSAVSDAVNKTGKDVAIIAYGRDVMEDDIVGAFRDGARALTLRSRPEHIQIIVRREFEALTMRRSARRLESALRESERRCDALLDSSRDPVAYVHEGMHVRANKAYLEMFGFSDFDDIEGMSILDMIAASDADEFKALLKRLSKGEKPPQRLNLKAQRSDGSTFDAVMEFSEAHYEGEPCQQIIFRLPGNEQVQTNKDLITELFTRQHTLAELDHVVAAAVAGKRDQAIVLLEPDKFNVILDTIGLGNTDLLLRDIATLLRKYIKDVHVTGRFADHTFGILMTEGNVEEVQKLTEILRKAFEEYIFEVDKQTIGLTVSMGVVLIGEKNANTTMILNQAQTALRGAQSEGGNRVKVLDPAAKDKAEEEKNRHWLQLIEEALAGDGFVLFYQPIISLHGAEGEFYEILLRLDGPKGEITPQYFMPIAEQHGLLAAIDRWAIGHAIRSLVEREKLGHNTTFFIKLSPPSLEDATLLPWIAEQLKEARLRGDALVFEMAESKVVTNLKHARSFVKNLEQLHCGFALEQFGSGLNSFQLLKHIPAHYLKIDRSYMMDLSKSKENQDKIKELCDQAHQSGKLTVAEFVEDAASMSILFACGVNFVQGNFLQEPQKVMAYDFGNG